jgi:hypothetical protein
VAASREERELELDGALDVASGTSEQGPEASVEPELLAVCADEVQDRAERLVLRLSESAAELLEEQGRALGGPEHEDGVDVGHVDALVEQVDREHDAHAAGGEVPQRAFAFAPAGLT